MANNESVGIDAAFLRVSLESQPPARQKNVINGCHGVLSPRRKERAVGFGGDFIEIFVPNSEILRGRAWGSLLALGTALPSPAMPSPRRREGSRHIPFTPNPPLAPTRLGKSPSRGGRGAKAIARATTPAGTGHHLCHHLCRWGDARMSPHICLGSKPPKTRLPHATSPP